MDQNSWLRGVASTTLLVTVLAMLPGPPASAVPVFETKLEHSVSGNVIGAGTNFVTAEDSTFAGANNGFFGGTVEILGTDIISRGKAQTGQGTDAGVDAFGRYVFDDFIFSSLTNPGGGSITVSANFNLNWATNDPNASADLFHVQASIHGDSVLDDQYFNPVPITTAVTTSSTTVPLNEFVSFSAIADLRIYDNVGVPNGLPGNVERGTGFFGLADIPFILPAGFTVNSVSAGIFDNSFSPPPAGNNPAVPEPATLGLFAFGLASLGTFGRRLRSKPDVPPGALSKS